MSYMLRDAQMGRLPGLPENVLDSLSPVSDRVWEASRVFINGHRRERGEVRELLLLEMLKVANEGGAEKILCLLPSWWPRLRRSGLSVKAAGPLLDIGGPHQAVEIDIQHSPLLHGRMDGA